MNILSLIAPVPITIPAAVPKLMDFVITVFQGNSYTSFTSLTTGPGYPIRFVSYNLNSPVNALG